MKFITYILKKNPNLNNLDRFNSPLAKQETI